MSNYDNTNRGALFKNDKKQTDNHPDYKGKINVNGQDFWLSAWIKKKKDNSGSYMSLSVQPMQQQNQAYQNQGYEPQQPPVEHNNFDDDIPF